MCVNGISGMVYVFRDDVCEIFDVSLLAANHFWFVQIVDILNPRVENSQVFV